MTYYYTHCAGSPYRALGCLVLTSLERDSQKPGHLTGPKRPKLYTIFLTMQKSLLSFLLNYQRPGKPEPRCHVEPKGLYNFSCC